MFTKPLVTAVALASLVLPQTLHADGDKERHRDMQPSLDVKRDTLKTKQDPPLLRPERIRLIDGSLGKVPASPLSSSEVAFRGLRMIPALPAILRRGLLS